MPTHWYVAGREGPIFGNNRAWKETFGRRLQDMFETSVQRKTIMFLLSSS